MSLTLHVFGTRQVGYESPFAATKAEVLIAEYNPSVGHWTKGDGIPEARDLSEGDEERLDAFAEGRNDSRFAIIAGIEFTDMSLTVGSWE